MSSEKQPIASGDLKREADLYDLLAWLEVNRKMVAIVVVALVIIGFVVATVRYMGKQKEETASAELLALKPALVTPTNATPAQPTAFLKVADEFSGTSAAQRARIFAATGFFTEGRYADAQKEFSRFLQDFPSSPWAANAAYGVAASQEANNQTNEALASYQNVVTAYPSSAVVRDAKLALARMYESRNQPDQALRLYEELTAPVPGQSPAQMGASQAEERKEALLRSHPNLNTNRVAPGPMTMPVIQPAATTNQSGTASAKEMSNAPAATAAQPESSAPPAAQPAEPKP